MHGWGHISSYSLTPTTNFPPVVQIMASRCVGELCRKMGERVLTRIMPILREGVGGAEAATRRGVCLGLKEVRGLRRG